LFDARKHRSRTFSEVRGKVGSVTAVEGQGMFVMSQGGQIEVLRVRYDDGKKMSAAQFCADFGVTPQNLLGE
jgi:methionyl-tRNA formyltransferase